MYHKSNSFHLHQTKSLLSNYNPNHFSSNIKHDRSTIDVSKVEELRNGTEDENKKYTEDQLLMVRTRHYCEKFMEPVPEIISQIKNTRLEMVRMAEIVEK
jgi:hypothetical protein